MKRQLTELVLEYCYLVDSENSRKEHSNWCEYIAGSHYYCDCGFDKKFQLYRTILMMKQKV